MRSSKSRSRGSKNRSTNRPTGGNIINRVFDSSGPDGKVRGTPQQIIDKYNQLHRDAQLSGDRVAAENFAQHAEHYQRMLTEALLEVEKAREEQEEANRQRQAERDRERTERLRVQEEAANAGGTESMGEQPDLPAADARADSGLVETPESQPKPRRPRTRKPRPAPTPDEGGQGQDMPSDATPGPAEAAE